MKKKTSNREESFPDKEPIEPEDRKTGKRSLLKWLFFLSVITYALLSYFHASLLTRIGRYLILEHPPQKSDIIICLSGGNIERGLEAADAYQKGLAPLIFVSREERPDGYELLRDRGVHYPETVEMLVMVLEGLGVPNSAVFTSDRVVESTVEEAIVVKDFVEKRGYRSLILITSPTHSKRAWRTFKKVFGENDIRILMRPTHYSSFSPEDWWKKRRYVRGVIIEYQKLIYYALKHFW